MRRPSSNYAWASLLAIATGVACPLPAPAQQTPAPPAPGSEAFFRERVEPLLREHCYDCHSHQAKKAQGGLVLDSRAGWEKGGQSGPAVVPGDAEQSLLISAVRYEGLEMPPKGRLSEEQITVLQQWIAAGAVDPRKSAATLAADVLDVEAGREHWAFQPLRVVTPPPVEAEQWPWSVVDRFLLADLEQAGVQPLGDADRHVWLRRVSFDLTGLPPTLEDIRSFLEDPSPHARARVVDRLLASPAFGERWGRHWLDLTGYADQVGTSNNVFAEHAWRYRDYVIAAFNGDKPFDEFVCEQIAGDLLPAATPQERAEHLTATGFLVLGDVEIVEADKAKLRVDLVDQQLNKVGKAFLAMTLECARCHDHKFDPIPQRDYYAMAGFFHATSSVHKTSRGVWSDVNVLELPETEQQRAARAALQEAHERLLAAWRAEREQAVAAQAEAERELQRPDLSEEQKAELTRARDASAGRIAELNRRIPHAEFFAPAPPRVHGVRDVEAPEDMRITIRGNPRALGEVVPRGFPQAASNVRPLIPEGQSGRRELAEWIACQPLAARVVCNRVWQRLFGAGLVRTVDYFGLPGDRPSHPELLDHLADMLMREGWSLKRLIRTLTLSRAYALDSGFEERAFAADPDNRLLWRMNRWRWDAEALRDGMLAVSGRLLASPGGPSLPLEFPENVGGLSPTDVNPPSFNLSRWRPEQAEQRTVYLPVIRHAAQPGPAALRNVFDFPQPSQFTGRRDVTAVPTQALFLMNSPVVQQHAAALAARLGKFPAAERLETLWLLLLNRPLREAERADAEEFLREAGEAGWTELCRGLLASNEFLMRL